VLFVFFVLRLPSLNEPYWYGDEGIYQVIGRAIDSGRILYKDIWDNKPPLLYLIYAFFYGNLFLVKLASLITGLFTVLAFYILSTKLFKKEKIVNITTIIFSVLFGLPILEGNIANAENFMILPVILAATLVLSYFEKKQDLKLVFAGFLLSIALITKIVAIFDFTAFSFFLFILNFNSFSKFKKSVKISDFLPFLKFLLAFLSLFLVCLIYFFSKDAFIDFFSAVFSQNIGYVGTQNSLLFPMGALILKSFILIFALVFIFVNRRKISSSTLFIYVWFAFSLYNAFFSQRPYTHYLLVVLPVFSLLTGFLFLKTKKKLAGVFVILVVLAAVLHFKVYPKILGYYQNYIEFTYGNLSAENYENFFDPSTPLNYEIAQFIDLNTKPSETVFLWSDDPQIYALSNKLPVGKYIVAYHITFYKNAENLTRERIEKVNPKYIIQNTSTPLIDDILTNYTLRYQMKGVKIYEREI
jgi:hypothetical protein